MPFTQDSIEGNGLCEEKDRCLFPCTKVRIRKVDPHRRKLPGGIGATPAGVVPLPGPIPPVCCLLPFFSVPLRANSGRMAMQSLSAYEIRFSALKNGFHYYDYALESDFFSLFPDSLIHQARVDVRLCMERKTREMVLDFDFGGIICSTCDRCLRGVEHPVRGQSRLLVKIEEEQTDNTDQIWYVTPTCWSFQLAEYLYESVSLLLPLRFVCTEAQQEACDERLNAWISTTSGVEPGGGEMEETADPRWEKLKQLKYT